MKKVWVLSYPLSAQRRLWSDWAHAQADLSLRWTHMPFCCFCHEAAHLRSGIWNLSLYLNSYSLQLHTVKTVPLYLQSSIRVRTIKKKKEKQIFVGLFYISDPKITFVGKFNQENIQCIIYDISRWGVCSLRRYGMTKATKWPVRPVKTQISLGIRPVWSELSGLQRTQGFFMRTAKTDQTGRMPRLLWVFAGRTGHFVGFVVLQPLIYKQTLYCWGLNRKEFLDLLNAHMLLLLLLACFIEWKRTLNILYNHAA